MLTIEHRTIIIFWAGSPKSFKACLFGICSWSHTWPPTIKKRCWIKISNWIRLIYLKPHTGENMKVQVGKSKSFRTEKKWNSLTIDMLTGSFQVFVHVETMVQLFTSSLKTAIRSSTPRNLTIPYCNAYIYACSRYQMSTNSSTPSNLSSLVPPTHHHEWSLWSQKETTRFLELPLGCWNSWPLPQFQKVLCISKRLIWSSERHKEHSRSNIGQASS